MRRFKKQQRENCHEKTNRRSGRVRRGGVVAGETLTKSRWGMMERARQTETVREHKECLGWEGIMKLGDFDDS